MDHLAVGVDFPMDYLFRDVKRQADDVLLSLVDDPFLHHAQLPDHIIQGIGSFFHLHPLPLLALAYSRPYPFIICLRLLLSYLFRMFQTQSIYFRFLFLWRDIIVPGVFETHFSESRRLPAIRMLLFYTGGLDDLAPIHTHLLHRPGKLLCGLPPPDAWSHQELPAGSPRPRKSLSEASFRYLP